MSDERGIIRWRGRPGHGLVRMLALALAAGGASNIAAASAQTIQPGDHSDYAAMAMAARKRDDLKEAVRLQRLAVEQADINAANYPAIRSKWRYNLGMLLVAAKDCISAIPIFEEAEQIVATSRPNLETTVILSDWYENALWASFGIASARLCLDDPDGALARLADARKYYAAVKFAPKVKVLIETLRASAYLMKVDKRNALAALDKAFEVLKAFSNDRGEDLSGLTQTVIRMRADILAIPD